MRILAGFHYKLVESRRFREQDLAVLAELTGGVSGLREILLSQFLQSHFAVDSHKNVDHQRDQRLICADIRGGLLAPDVLLARGEREHESAFALLVDGLTHEASRHLADIFL